MPIHLKIDVGRMSGGVINGWSQDTYYTGGSTYAWTQPINLTGLTDPAPMAVYQPLRYGDFSYTLPGFAPGSTVKLRLHFADIETASGSRRFSIAVGGVTPALFSNVDVAQLVGNVSYKGVILEYQTTANGSGQVLLSFQTIFQNPIINGIEAIELSVPSASFTKTPSAGSAPLNVAFTDTSTNSPTAWAWSFGDGGTSNLQNPSHLFAANGTYTISLTATNAFGSTTTTQTITLAPPPPLPYGFTPQGVELFFEANLLSQSNGSNLAFATDQSANARHLTADAPTPTFVTNAVSGKATARFSGTQNPLTNPAVFTLRCAFLVAKYDGALFPDDANGYKGLLSPLFGDGILVGNRNSADFYNYVRDLYEFRSNDLIKPQSDADAPMNSYRLIFVRFWQNIQMNGVVVGQDSNNVNRKWKGDVPLVILTSRDFCEADVRARSAAIAAAYGITLADVLPYPADDDVAVSSAENVSYYDPPEGARVSEITGDGGKIFDLQFTSRRRQEKEAIETYHETHYSLSIPCVHRSFQQIPPKDFSGYIDSPLKLNGKNGNYNYSFRFVEKKNLI